MKPNFFVVDNPFNRYYNPKLIGFIFRIAPSYCAVKPVNLPADFENFHHWKLAQN